MFLVFVGPWRRMFWPGMAKDWSFACGDCRERFDFFMAKDSMWASAGLKHEHNVCPSCLGKRLGRQLTIEDYRDDGDGFRHTAEKHPCGPGQMKELIERLGRMPTLEETPTLYGRWS